MRLALFETLDVSCSIQLDKILHVLTAPKVFRLPLLRSCFSGGLVYQGQVVPLLVCKPPQKGDKRNNHQPSFTLVCEAEFGLVAVPADKIVRITNEGEIGSETISGCNFQSETFEIDGRDYRLLDLNQVLDDSGFTICGLKD